MSIFVIAVIVLLAITAVRWPAQARKAPNGDTFAAVLLVKSGTELRLGRGWEHGDVTVSPGVLTFGGVGAFGVKTRRREPLVIEVTEVAADTGKVGWGQMFSLNPLFATVACTTPTGVLLVAASPAAINHLRKRVAAA
jgi:hypothetical protein